MNFNVERIKEHAPEIYAHYLGKPSGGAANGRKRYKCPFHNDQHPSFDVWPDGGCKCHACGEGASDVLGFVAKIEGTQNDFPRTLKLAQAAASLSDAMAGASWRPEQRPSELTPAKEPRYIDRATLTAMERHVDGQNLFMFLADLFGRDETAAAMKRYHVGLSNEHPQGCGRSTAFPSIDTFGNIHAIKHVPFPEHDHHRVKGKGGADMIWRKGENVEGAYFGAHLLQSDQGKPVALVESEKTAIVGAIAFPAYIWIATQGIANFSLLKAKSLKGRDIHVFPDSDGIEDKTNGKGIISKGWRSIAAELSKAGHRVVFRDELIGQYPPQSKTDIADIIIAARQAQQKPPQSPAMAPAAQSPTEAAKADKTKL